MLKVNETFVSLQGEGKYCGHKVLFIRLSGCNKSCSFCDTSYHNAGKEIYNNSLIEKIFKSDCDNIVWTGGEPMLQKEQVRDVILQTSIKNHMIETNGTILDKDFFDLIYYTAFSPKCLDDLKAVKQFVFDFNGDYDIKIVTDGEKIGMDMIDDATMLMPLSVYEEGKDLEIKKRVWELCIEKNKIYCPRIHVDVFGKKRGI